MNIPTDNDYVNFLHDVTMQAGDSYTATSDYRLSFQAGTFTVDGGYCASPVRWYLTGGAALVIGDGGYLSVGRPYYSGTGAVPVTINGGEYFYNTSTNPQDIPVTLNSGTLTMGLPTNISNGGATYTLNGGTWNTAFGNEATGNTLFVSFANVSWNHATISNLFQYNDYFGNVLVSLGSSADNTIDINAQNIAGHIGVAQMWDVKGGGRDVYPRFNNPSGNIQIDVYSATDDDSDTIVNANNSSSLNSNAVMLIGYAGPTITDPNDFVGKSYVLITKADGTWGNLAPSVPDAIWDDGTNQYAVSFTNNVSTDGTITIASIGLIPEPATIAMLVVGATALLRRRGR